MIKTYERDTTQQQEKLNQAINSRIVNTEMKGAIGRYSGKGVDKLRKAYHSQAGGQRQYVKQIVERISKVNKAANLQQEEDLDAPSTKGGSGFGTGTNDMTFSYHMNRKGGNVLRVENSDAMLEDFRSQVKHGQPINFRNFGLQNSALADLKRRESMEQIVKKKDYMADVHMQKRILNQMRVRQSKEANIFDKLSVSLSLDQQLLNHGVPIYQSFPKTVNNATKDSEEEEDEGVIGSPVRQQSVEKQKRDQDDLMFQTEIDVGPISYHQEATPKKKSMKTLVSEYRSKIIDDQVFKPLIQQLLKSNRKEDSFDNHEDRIMYKYTKGLGVFNKKGSTGRKIPPSVVLQGLRKQAMRTASSNAEQMVD